MVKARLQSVCARLRENGCRVTPQRLAVVELVFGSRSHPTAQDVYESLREQYPTMSLTTVYKTLHLLESLGEVAPVATDVGTTHYDGDTSVHVHLVCSRCGVVADVAGAMLPDSLTTVQAQGWVVSHWKLEVAGLCPRCSGDGKGNVPEGSAGVAWPDEDEHRLTVGQ